MYGPAVRKHVQSQQQSQSSSSTPPTVFNIFAVRYKPRVSKAAAFASLQHVFWRTVLKQLPAEDVVNLQSVDGLPLVLAALIVLLGLMTLGNTLVTSVRRRRRDLAISKAIGFVRTQVAAVVAWQATSSLLALLVGIPVGIAGGRWAWSTVASGIGSSSPPIVPVLAVGLVPGTLVCRQPISALACVEGHADLTQLSKTRSRRVCSGYMHRSTCIASSCTARGQLLPCTTISRHFHCTAQRAFAARPWSVRTIFGSNHNLRKREGGGTWPRLQPRMQW